MVKKFVPIKYTNRDYNSIKTALVEHARRYYPQTMQDFNEASFGALMLDTVAYVGDVLSFYLDYQANESYLDTALEYANIVKISKQMGYKLKGSASATGIVTLFVVVPAASTGGGPDMDYVPTLKRGTQFANSAGNQYLLVEDVNFSDSDNEVVVARVDSDGTPLQYAIKSYGRVISGDLAEDVIEIGAFEKLRRVPLNSDFITDVISVVDAEGHEYYEVEYLSQDTIYKEYRNQNFVQNGPKSILKPFPVPRRFTVERDGDITYLQFGYGSESSLTDDPIKKASEVILQYHGKDYSTDQQFDPSNLRSTDKLGVGPSLTTLKVTYLTNTAQSVSAPVNTINDVTNPIVDIPSNNVTPTILAEVIASIEVTNEEPIIGDVTEPTADEVRRHAMDVYASQNRAVTSQDYVSLVYRMPPTFGSIKRCAVSQDLDSLKRNLNLYVMSESTLTGKLVKTNSVTKQNLKNWLSQYKMVNDTIDIVDANIINIGIELELMADLSYNKYSVLELAKREISLHFGNKPEVGEFLYITDIYNLLKNTQGILDVIDVKIVTMTGDNYSDYTIDIDDHMSADGRILHIPEDAIYELKFPRTDIKGTIK
tara:strand:- start:4476 stop:6266 length:1791 start_codon:yes stop_codon:yes gene_type:complete